jgi:sodium pump decarboxylase gamma subunit
MIIEGLKLTLLGMPVVFAFLWLLILVIKLSAWFLRDVTAREAAEADLPVKRRRRPTTDEANRRLTGIITAAISAHRARYGSRRGSSSGNSAS